VVKHEASVDACQVRAPLHLMPAIFLAKSGDLLCLTKAGLKN
jgi:hypothetical protein